MPDPLIELRLPASLQRQLGGLRVVLGPENLRQAILAFFDREALRMSGRISAEMVRGKNRLHRTGTLARSVTGGSELFGGLPAIRVGIFRSSGAERYAGVQELGTRGKNESSPFDTIRPKHGKALAIPVGRALTGAGVDRYGGARFYPRPLKFIPSHNSGVHGNVIGVLVDDAQSQKFRGTKKTAKALYILLRFVDIPAHFFLRDGFNRYLPELVNRMAALFLELFKRATPSAA